MSFPTIHSGTTLPLGVEPVLTLDTWSDRLALDWWLDETVIRTVVEGIPPEVAFVLVFLSFAGSIWVIGPATILAYWLLDDDRGLQWILVMVGCYGLLAAIKAVFSIPRPPVDPPIGADAFPLVLEPVYHTAAGLDSESFPSGHALAATVFYGILAIDLELTRRRYQLLIAAAVITSIGAIRLLLGMHYVGDVVVGFVIGLVYLLVVLLVRHRSSQPLLSLLLVAVAAAGVALYGDRAHEAVDLLAAVTGGVIAIETVGAPVELNRPSTPLALAAAGAIVLFVLVGLLTDLSAISLTVVVSFVLGFFALAAPAVLAMANRPT